MATPLEFLERAIPWPEPNGSGWGNLHWSLTKDGAKRWRGSPFKTAKELISRAQQLAMAPADKAEDIFFCTSLQSQTESIKYKDHSFTVASRHANTACAIKALFLDIDVKDPPKGYASKTEAWDALKKFIIDAALPQPSAIVWSGGGMHVYWFSSRSLTVPEWRPFAEGLKSEAMRLGLRCDYGVTTDAARILRVPGTFNRKNPGAPRPVKIVALGNDYNFDVDLAHLKTVGAPLVTATVSADAPFDLSAFKGGMHPLVAKVLAAANDNLADGLGYSELPPLDPTEVIKGCPHFTDAFKNHGQGHGQGLWMLTVLASTFFENGEKWAKHFSDQYPSFDQGELDKMWGRKMDDRAKGMGWPACRSFENEGCKHCATCAFKPMGKSPLNLASRVKPVAPAIAPQTVTNPITNAVLTAQDLHLPDGYVLNNGLISLRINDQEDPEEPPEYRYLPIFFGEVISVPRTSNSRPPTLYFRYRHGKNFCSVTVPYDAYKSDQALQAVLLLQGVTTKPAADRYVRSFMRSWTAEIDAAHARLTSAPFGWVVENGIPLGFAYGGTLFRTNGAEDESGHADSSFAQWYTPSGEVSKVMDALRALSERNHPALEVLCLQSWASPLLYIAGLKSTAVVWGFSNEAGAQKSTALRTGMALWSSPDKTRERGGVTVTGLENKMHQLRNLPAVVDEMTDSIAVDLIAPIFNRIHEGGQGTRADRHGGIRDPKHWQLILTCGANMSIYEYQDTKGVQTDAKAVRAFQVKVEKIPGTRNRTEMDQLIGDLDYNYGHLGLRYAKYLSTNLHSIFDEYRILADEVERDLATGAGRMDDQDRFWKATVVLTLLAARLANRVLNGEYFHYEELKRFLYKQFHDNKNWVAGRVTIAGSTQHTGEAWAKLLRGWINNQIVTDTMHTGAKGRAAAVDVISQPPLDRGYPINMHWLQNPPMIRVAQMPLHDAMIEMGYGAGMMDRMEKDYGGTVSRKTFLAGIPVKEAKTRINVWEIPIHAGHPLYEQWAAKVAKSDPATPASAAAIAQDNLVEALEKVK